MLSAVGMGAGQSIPIRYPWVQPYIAPTTNPIYPTPEAVGREEFDALRREIKELRTLLVAAKRYDSETGQPDCESEDKVALLKRLAALVGVDLDDVLAI